MATITAAALSTVLKEDWLPGIMDTTVRPYWFLDLVETDATDIRNAGGNSYKSFIKLKVAKAMGIGPRGAGKALPAHRNASWDTTDISLVRLYASAEYDGPVVNINSAAALVDGIDDAIKDIKDGIRFQANAMFTGVGTDAIAQVASTHTTSTTVTCTNSYLYPGTRRLQQGLVIDSYNGTTGKDTNTIGLDAGSVSSITSRTQFVTTEVNTSDASDYIMWGDGNGSDVDAHPMGIAAIVDGPDDQSTWRVMQNCQTIDGGAAGKEFWQSYVSSNNGTLRYLDEEYILDLAMGIRGKRNGQMLQDGYFLASQPEVFTRYRKEVTRDRGWQNKTRIQAGVAIVDQMLDDKVVPWVTDPMFGRQSLYCIHGPSLVFKSLPMEVMDPEGFVRLENYDTMRMQVKQYAQLGTKERNPHAVMRDVYDV